MYRRMTIAAVLTLLSYLTIWVGWHHGWWLHVDWPLLNAAHTVGKAHPGWVTFWSAVSGVVPTPLHVIESVVFVLAVATRRMRVALMILVCGPPNDYFVDWAKDFAHRPRPYTMLVHESATSFPSGHATETTLFTLSMLVFLWPMLSGVAKELAVTVGIFFMLLVGMARVALNVHNPTDVLAGYCLGYLVFFIAFVALRPLPPSGAPASPDSPSLIGRSPLPAGRVDEFSDHNHEGTHL